MPVTRKQVEHLEEIHLQPGKIPDDYHCRCPNCCKFLGELIREDGTNYNRNERRKYYSKTELSNAKEGEKGGHVAKTPLHIARWAIQKYSREGDWVLDPTIGAGTTAVEALRQGRNVAGMELEFVKILQENVRINNPFNKESRLWHGDARSIGSLLGPLGVKFQLIVNNPPYSGDESQKGLKVREGFTYDKDLPNLAFLKEGEEYYRTMGSIYRDSTQYLLPGGRLVIGVKDQMRNKKPDMLHQKLIVSVLENCPGMTLEGTVVLRHYPTTLFLNTYFRQFGIHPPYFQTISVFRKGLK